jgi:hypothetical protein
MRKQQGFSVVEACLILITVTVIAFAGWFVWSKQSEKKAAIDPAVALENERLNAEAAKYEAFFDASEGYQFSYLKEWSATKAQRSDGRAYIKVTSPDYVDTSAYENGVNTYHKGAYIEVSSQEDKDFKTIDEYLKGGQQGLESEIVNPKKITIDGQPGVTYRLESLGPAKQVAFTRAKGKVYQMVYLDPNTNDFEKYRPDFDKLVESFNIISAEYPDL